MSEYNIGQQNAHNIYNADNIYFQPDPAALFSSGVRALAGRDYATACTQLAAAVKANPADTQAQYYLSLAQLEGKRPHSHSAARVAEVEQHLVAAAALPEAQALRVLVQEDYRMSWKNSSSVPDSLMRLGQSVTASRAREIVQHVPAPESRVWRVLKARAEG